MGRATLQNLRVAVDVGGTFTDICIMDEDTGLIRIEKTSSTKDPIEGILAGVGKAGIDLSKVALFSHGTTVATTRSSRVACRAPPWCAAPAFATCSKSAAPTRRTSGTSTRTS